jgi:hypothetical protein
MDAQDAQDIVGRHGRVETETQEKRGAKIEDTVKIITYVLNTGRHNMS